MNGTTTPDLSTSAVVPRKGARGRRVWDQLTIYLPVLLMALLAAGSYWLLRATPEPVEPPPERPPTHEPDYRMRGFSVKVFETDGQLRSEIFGAEARHHPDSDTTEIDQARIRSVGPEGQVTTATAQRIVSNAGQTEFLLEGDAVVIREASAAGPSGGVPRLEFRGDSFQVFTQPERVVSDRPVEMIRGQDRLSGASLDYRGGDLRSARLTGGVRAVLSPR